MSVQDISKIILSVHGGVNIKKLNLIDFQYNINVYIIINPFIMNLLSSKHFIAYRKSWAY